MSLKLSMGLVALVSVALMGCSSKGYVDKKMAELQVRVDTQLDSVKVQSSTNADEIEKMKALTGELSQKVDKLPNQVTGYENYKVIWEGSVNFGFDSQDISDVSSEILGGLGQKMVDVPKSVLEIAGHTDKTGPANYNFQLGIRRAESVKTFLTDKYGVPLYRMYTVSFGNTKPLAMPDQTNANAKNRRVMLRLWGPPTA